jgi:hypothetical protein
LINFDEFKIKMNKIYYKPFFGLNIPLELVIYIIQCAIENKCQCFKYDIIIAMKNVSRRWKRKLILIQKELKISDEELTHYLQSNKTQQYKQYNYNIYKSKNQCNKLFKNTICELKCSLCNELYQIEKPFIQCQKKNHRCFYQGCLNHNYMHELFQFNFCSQHIMHEPRPYKYFYHYGITCRYFNCFENLYQDDFSTYKYCFKHFQLWKQTLYDVKNNGVQTFLNECCKPPIHFTNSKPKKRKNKYIKQKLSKEQSFKYINNTTYNKSLKYINK